LAIGNSLAPEFVSEKTERQHGASRTPALLAIQEGRRGINKGDRPGGIASVAVSINWQKSRSGGARSKYSGIAGDPWTMGLPAASKLAGREYQWAPESVIHRPPLNTIEFA